MGRGAGSCTVWVLATGDSLLAVDTQVLDFDTAGTRILDITADARRFCRSRGDGLLHAFAPHATAGLALMETGADSEADLEDALERLLPRDDRYRHRHGSTGHGADHLLPVVVAPFLVIPVVGGELALGTWQSVVLVDLNADNARRHVRLTWMEG